MQSHGSVMISKAQIIAMLVKTKKAKQPKLVYYIYIFSIISLYSLIG